MRRFRERSVKRMLGNFILEEELPIYSHQLLKEKRAEYAAKIPGLAKIDCSLRSYYCTMKLIKDFLLEEHNRPLINIRGKGYKLANEPEKEYASYLELETAGMKLKMAYRIAGTVKRHLIDDYQRELCDGLRSTSKVGFQLVEQLIEDIKGKKLLPEDIKKQLK